MEIELFFWAINLITLNKINIVLDIGSLLRFLFIRDCQK